MRIAKDCTEAINLLILVELFKYKSLFLLQAKMPALKS
jgi:hypothetical protein